ncbi:unnamed protein product [Phaedon cochleariae]|uniref:Chorion peroxidase n=1 Tax=Phaedon cochleariae TaxID=80249 RepID=A0A9P0GS25_PHACE|nr:unnamed protein product [Phaedon cochleariae]
MLFSINVCRKVMASASERTRLLTPEESQPQYVFENSTTRERKRRVRQFQCCICAIFLTIFLVALIMTVMYSITERDLPNNATDSPTGSDSTTVNIDAATTPIPVFVLLSNIFPIGDVENKNETTNDALLWKEAIQAGQSGLEEKDKIETYVPSLQLRSPSYRHQRVVATSEKGRNLSRIGFVEEYATRHIHRKRKNNTLVEKICHKDNTTSDEYCRKSTMECNIFLMKYRTYNGTCNNLQKPLEYGASYRPFRRSLPPDYADGISEPRVSKSGDPLPSARTVSLVVHRPYYRNDPKFSVMLAVWGQFLDHDITATALSQKSNGSSISCCDPQAVSSPECFPVQLDWLDPFREYNVSCIEFVRSAPAPTCCLGPREQLNQVTPVIDGSVIYSAEEEVAKKLRNMVNGTMRVIMTADNRTLLPASEDLNDGCNREEEEKNGRYCFLTGDARANENLYLTSMHLLWVRQHNLIAYNLSRLNPHWKDEIVFQETRRIIGAQMQHITYNEFLPILLGDSLMQKFDLNPLKKGYSKTYNASLDPTIANNFAAASFRFAHSIIPGLMKLLSNYTSTPEYVQMRKMLFNPFQLYDPEVLDKTLRGAMNTTIEASDSYFTNELKSHMFEKSTEKFKEPKLCGLDLVSLNVQRGRDHGLPGYTSWRTHCKLSKPKSFDDLKNDMDSYSLYNIKAIYKDVDDIDLYTGALSEIPLEGSILGPTITCLILDQFYRIKHGDRFWYENPQKPQSFTPEQLSEIKKTTLGNVICDTSDGLHLVQRRVMERVENDDEYISCSEVDRPNLELWKENLHHVDMSDDSLTVKTAG